MSHSQIKVTIKIDDVVFVIEQRIRRLKQSLTIAEHISDYRFQALTIARIQEAKVIMEEIKKLHE